MEENAIQKLIEDERHRLMRAEAILGCLTECLSESPEARIDFSEVAGAAHDLIKAAINNLDSTNLRRMLKRR